MDYQLAPNNRGIILSHQVSLFFFIYQKNPTKQKKKAEGIFKLHYLNKSINEERLRVNKCK